MINMYQFQTLGVDATGLENLEKGLEVLQYFHERAQNYPAYTFSFDDLKQAMMPGRNELSINMLISGLGDAVNFAELSMSEVKDLMYELADRGEGKIPGNWNSFRGAIEQGAKGPGFFDAVSFVTTESVKDLVSYTGQGISAAASVTTSVFKNYKLLLIVAALGLGVLLISQTTKLTRVLQ